MGNNPAIRVALRLPSPADILTRCYPNGRLGGITVEGNAPGAVGQFVQLTLSIEKPAREFTVYGQLAWARHSGSNAFRASFGIDFVHQDEGGHTRLMAFANSDLSPESMRGEMRLAVDLPVKVKHQGEWRKEFLADLSLGGAFVRSASPLAIGETVELSVRPPRALLSFSLVGRVVWVRNAGSAAGMGIAFNDPADSRMRLSKFLNGLEAQARTG